MEKNLRKIDFNKFEVDEESQEIIFSCASELPYTRYECGIEYDEVLKIDKNSVDLSRLNGGASVLFNHDPDQLLGVVEKAFIANRKVFVTCRFSKNDHFSVRIYKDILEGLVKNISIGYQILDYEDFTENGRNIRNVTKWMIYEVSVVSIPADASVGIRSLKVAEEEKVEEPVEEEKVEETAPAEEAVETEEAVEEKPVAEEAVETEEEPVETEKEKVEKAVETEEEKVVEEEIVEETAPALDEEEKVEIEKIGSDFGVAEEEVKRAISENLSVREFKNLILTKNKTFKIKENKNMNRKEFTDYLNARNFDNPFTLRDFSGFAPAGLVATETMPLVAALEKRLGVKGFRTISGLNSQIEIPVQTGRHTVYAPGVNETGTDSNPEITKLVLAPKKFVASTVIGKEMLVASNSDIEAFIVDAITKELAYEVENYMLEKVLAGAGKEINYSNINAITWQDVLAFESAIGGFNTSDASFVMSAPARAALKGIEKAEGTARYICENNEVNGYKVEVSGCVKNDNIYFGDWSNLVLATFGEGLSITIDPYTEARSGAVVVVGSICVDSGLIAPAAFTVGKVQD